MYAGVLPTLMYGALARFGDTAANAGVLHALDHRDDMSVGAKTVLGSGVAAAWRGVILPLETWKQNLQVRGGERGKQVLVERVKQGGLRGLWHGMFASCSAAFFMHLPFFFTVNTMSQAIPSQLSNEDRKWYHEMMQNGGVGFCASIAADCATNGFKVIATTQQTNRELYSTASVVRRLVRQDGLVGLLGRGLKTRILSNAMQGAFFVVVWKELEKQFQ